MGAEPNAAGPRRLPGTRRPVGVVPAPRALVPRERERAKNARAQQDSRLQPGEKSTFAVPATAGRTARRSQGKWKKLQARSPNSEQSAEVQIAPDALVQWKLPQAFLGGQKAGSIQVSKGETPGALRRRCCRERPLRQTAVGAGFLVSQDPQLKAEGACCLVKKSKWRATAPVS